MPQKKVKIDLNETPHLTFWNVVKAIKDANTSSNPKSFGKLIEILTSIFFFNAPSSFFLKIDRHAPVDLPCATEFNLRPRLYISRDDLLKIRRQTQNTLSPINYITNSLSDLNINVKSCLLDYKNEYPTIKLGDVRPLLTCYKKRFSNLQQKVPEFYKKENENEDDEINTFHPNLIENDPKFDQLVFIIRKKSQTYHEIVVISFFNILYIRNLLNYFEYNLKYQYPDLENIKTRLDEKNYELTYFERLSVGLQDDEEKEFTEAYDSINKELNQYNLGFLTIASSKKTISFELNKTNFLQNFFNLYNSVANREQKKILSQDLLKDNGKWHDFLCKYVRCSKTTQKNKSIPFISDNAKFQLDNNKFSNVNHRIKTFSPCVQLYGIPFLFKKVPVSIDINDIKSWLQKIMENNIVGFNINELETNMSILEMSENVYEINQKMAETNETLNLIKSNSQKSISLGEKTNDNLKEVNERLSNLENGMNEGFTRLENSMTEGFTNIENIMKDNNKLLQKLVEKLC